MAIITEELRVAIREFKSSINSFNFVINYEEPPFPIGSIESCEAQLALANEYLDKYPDLNSEEFNTTGLPLYVKKHTTKTLTRERMLKEFPTSEETPSELLWGAYMVLDHGTHDERLKMLDKLEKYFEKAEKPITKG